MIDWHMVVNTAEQELLYRQFTSLSFAGLTIRPCLWLWAFQYALQPFAYQFPAGYHASL